MNKKSVTYVPESLRYEKKRDWGPRILFTGVLLVSVAVFVTAYVLGPFGK